MSNILWGLSLAFNIILLLVGLPLCLLICCCCKKHQNVIEKDLKSLARNHNIFQQDPYNQNQLVYQPQPQYLPQQQQQNLKRRPLPQNLQQQPLDPQLSQKNQKIDYQDSYIEEE